MLLIQNGMGAGFRDVLFSALLAMAAFDPGVATAQEWPKQIKLTEQHIRGFFAIATEMAKLVSGVDLKDLADADKPDPKVQDQAKLVAKKNGFASLAEFSDVSENILFIFMGIDPLDPQKKYQPAELIKQSISILKIDDSVPEEQKRVPVAMLEEAIQKIKPIRFENNISLVRKYHDKLPPLTKDERDKLCLAQLLVCSWAAFVDAECYHGRSCQADGDVRQ